MTKMAEIEGRQLTWFKNNMKGSFTLEGLYVEHVEMTQDRERYKISYINSRDLYIMENENSVIIDVAKDYGTLAVERDLIIQARGCISRAQAMQRKDGACSIEFKDLGLEDIDDDDADAPAFGD